MNRLPTVYSNASAQKIAKADSGTSAFDRMRSNTTTTATDSDTPETTVNIERGAHEPNDGPIQTEHRENHQRGAHGDQEIGGSPLKIRVNPVEFEDQRTTARWELLLHRPAT